MSSTAAAMLAASLALVPVPAVESVDVAASDAAVDYRADAVRATNTIRVNRDRARLAPGSCLQGFARRHAARMAAAGEIWHQDLDKVLAACHLSFVGENVAAGFPDGASVVRDGWMKSDSHRANILEPSFRILAVAARRDADGRWYAGQLFGRR